MPSVVSLKASKSILFNPEFPFKPAALSFHYGWLIAIAAASGMIASIPGQTIGVNVFTEKLIEVLGITRSDVSFAYLIGTTTSGFLLIWAGRLYDILGSRKLIALSSIGLGLSLCYMSQVDFVPKLLASHFGAEGHLRLLFIISLILGFFLIRFWGQGLVTMAGRNMVGKWWKYHRGKVLPFSGICVSVCFSLAPNVFNALIEWVDWRAAWQILGGALALGFALWGWLVFRDNPEECHLSVDAGIPPGEKQKDDPEFSVVRDFTRKEAMSCFAFYIFCGVFALQAAYNTAYTFHVISVSEEIGMSKAKILNLFILMAVIGGGISIVVGWMSDKYRLKYFAGFMASGMAVSSFGLITQIPGLMPVLLTVGMAITGGCFGTVSGAFLPRYFGLTHLGAISGVMMSTMIISSAIGPYAFSKLRDIFGSYQPAYWATLVIAISLVISSFWANNPQRKIKAQMSETES